MFNVLLGVVIGMVLMYFFEDTIMQGVNAVKTFINSVMK